MGFLVKNVRIVNEGNIFEGDVRVSGERIEKISSTITPNPSDTIIEGDGSWLLPGFIDDQVHFREPGLTHKAEIYTESRAAVAGGITSFMEMPNTVPNTLTQELLEQKYALGASKSLANYSFYMGASNDNLDEVLKTNTQNVCGVKVFMGSSTGNMLVDNEKTLEGIFSKSPMLVATHCEDEATIRRNIEHFKDKYGEDVPMKYHPIIRNEEACYLSSSMAVALAKKNNTRLHILHISTEKETHLFRNDIPLEQKRITAEACIHHLWFDSGDYDAKGSLIKWNPAVKSPSDREGILKALIDDRIDVLATDHAPHTLEEKSNSYFNAPSGGPLVQHALVALLQMYDEGKISIEKIVQKMAHNPAILFEVRERGYIREGYFADLVIVKPNKPWRVSKENIMAKCGWSPFEGETFNNSISHTFISGHLAWANGQIQEGKNGKRLQFDRE